MTGTSIAININGSVVAMSTAGGIEIHQEAVEYTPLPGSVSAEEAGWKHYRRGEYTSVVENDSFFSFSGAQILALIGVATSAVVAIGNVVLSSTATITSATIGAEVNSLSKMSIKAEVNGLPTLNS